MFVAFAAILHSVIMRHQVSIMQRYVNIAWTVRWQAEGQGRPCKP